MRAVALDLRAMEVKTEAIYVSDRLGVDSVAACRAGTQHTMLNPRRNMFEFSTYGFGRGKPPLSGPTLSLEVLIGNILVSNI